MCPPHTLSRYLTERVGFMYPVNRHLKMLLDKILTDPRWDLKFIGMQLIIESLALAAFNVQKVTTADPVARPLPGYEGKPVVESGFFSADKKTQSA